MSVVVISIMGILAGADGPTSIAKWALLKIDFLLQHLDWPYGIPRKDVFRRVLSALNPLAFQTCFAAWLHSLRDAAAKALDVEQPILAIDGTTLRRSHNRRTRLGALHSVSVWASELGLSLGQVACEERSNEITAIPEVVRLVDVRGAIISIDAIAGQTAIAAQIVDAGGDYVLVLKGNQEAIHQGVVDDLEQQVESDFSQVDDRSYETTERGPLHMVMRRSERTYKCQPPNLCRARAVGKA